MSSCESWSSLNLFSGFPFHVAKIVCVNAMVDFHMMNLSPPVKICEI